MEYASGGELYDYLNRMKRIPESQARAIFRQIVSAVHFLHKVCSWVLIYVSLLKSNENPHYECCSIFISFLEPYCSQGSEIRKYFN